MWLGKLRKFAVAGFELVAGIYAMGFAYIISKAPHPDYLLPLEVGFFVLMGAWMLVGTYINVRELLK